MGKQAVAIDWAGGQTSSHRLDGGQAKKWASFGWGGQMNKRRQLAGRADKQAGSIWLGQTNKWRQLAGWRTNK
jgi:hypothetical protein